MATMNLETPHIYGYHDWHLPSPSSTPKSADFSEAYLQTPKTDAFQTHFLDAFATPQINGQTTPVRTPLAFHNTPVARPSSSQSRKMPSPEDPAFHINHFSANGYLGLPPVDPSRRLSSSPGPSTNNMMEGAGGANMIGQGQLMAPVQMQTPPPTRDSSSRRKSQPIDQDTPSTTLTRRIATVTGSAAPGHELFSNSPVHFPHLQLPQDMTQYSHEGSISAPALPQSRLFWDPNQQGSMDVDTHNLADPFGPVQQQKLEPAINWQPFGTHAMQQPTFQVTAAPAVSQPDPFVSTSFDQSMCSQSPSFNSAPSGVDPSLLFSFESPMKHLSFSSDFSTDTITDENSRQPYEQQTKESMREREMARKIKLTRTNSNSSAHRPSLSRPGLQRSNTDSGMRRPRTLSVDSKSSTSTTGSMANIPRKSSPLKRLNQGPLMAIPESRTRTKTRLIIDENGRARTETVSVEEATISPRKDSKLSFSWEDLDTDSDPDKLVLSRSNSFVLPSSAPLSRQASKHRRVDSTELLDACKMPRSGSSTSVGSSTSFASVQSRPIERKKVPPLKEDNRRYSMPVFDDSAVFNLLPSNVPGPAGDAQGAIKRVVQGRHQKPCAQGVLEAHNQRWAGLNQPVNTVPSQPFLLDPFTTNSFNGFEAQFNPTMSHPQTLSAGCTRCICNSTENHGQMIQCQSCSKWLHVQCLGFHPNQLPASFSCVFCTGQKPPSRVARVGAPIRAAARFLSPLTHKSTFRR